MTDKPKTLAEKWRDERRSVNDAALARLLARFPSWEPSVWQTRAGSPWGTVRVEWCFGPVSFSLNADAPTVDEAIDMLIKEWNSIVDDESRFKEHE